MLLATYSFLAVVVVQRRLDGYKQQKGQAKQKLAHDLCGDDDDDDQRRSNELEAMDEPVVRVIEYFCAKVRWVPFVELFLLLLPNGG